MKSVKNPNDTAKNSAEFVDEARRSREGEGGEGREGAEGGESGERGERPSAEVRSIAIRCDGRVLLSTVDLSNVDLSKREIWVGLVLTEAEAAAIHARVNFDEAAAEAVGRLRALDKKAKAVLTPAPSPSEVGDDDDDECDD
jgi:hypothetical protein